MRDLRLTSLLSLLIILAAALVLGACGSNTALVEDPALENPATETPATEEPVTETPVVEDPVVETPVVEDPVVETHEPVQDPPEYDFTLDVLADTYRYGGSADGYSVDYYIAEEPYDWHPGPIPFNHDILAVDIYVDNATDLKAFVFDLTFEYDCMAIYFVEVYEGFLGAPHTTFAADDCFRQIQVMLNPDTATGVSGDALLTTVYFEIVGGAASAWSPAQIPPQIEDSRAVADFDDTTGELTWYYASFGDFDQNGLVNWFDIFPVAEFYAQQSSDPLSIPALIAGIDQLVLVPSLTDIGMNEGVTVDGYNIYAGAVASYPDGGTLLGSAALSTAIGDPTVERLSFSYTVTDPQPGDVYWVKPYYGSVEGIASNLTPE